MDENFQNVTQEQKSLSERIFLLALGGAFQLVFQNLDKVKKKKMEELFQVGSQEEKIAFIKKESPEFNTLFQKSLDKVRENLAKEVVHQAKTA